MPVDVRRELAPVSTVAANMFVLAVNRSLRVKSFPESIEYARKAHPPLTYASGGNGGIHHLTMEILTQRADIDLVHVPYKGGSPATTATVSGEVAAMFAGTSNAPQMLWIGIACATLKTAHAVRRVRLESLPNAQDQAHCGGEVCPRAGSAPRAAGF